MKLLYLSCHSILEYDEVKLFTEMGIDVFSHGVYVNPAVAPDNKRPAIKAQFHPDLYELAIAHDKDNLDQRLIDWADVIYVVHIADWIGNNWEKLKGKRIIWRSIGQSTLNVEALLKPYREKGVEIVRYSPREETIPGYVGSDALIRFYKDPEEFKGWRGEEKKIVTIGQSMKKRDQFCNWSIFERVSRGWPRNLFGSENEDCGEVWGGCIDYDAMKTILRSARVYFYTGTYPASYTLNFIEAWMTGIPIVALGRRLGSSPYEIGQSTYEVPDFLDETGGGLYSDDEEELKKFVRVFMEDYSFASKISERARNGAIKYFAKDVIKDQWKKFLKV
jgi:hypothetical protein